MLVPVSNATEVGLRHTITSSECDVLFKALGGDFVSPANDWKDRFKDFSEKMRTGNIFEVAEVLKHLNYLSHTTPLVPRAAMLERRGNWFFQVARRVATRMHSIRGRSGLAQAARDTMSAYRRLRRWCTALDTPIFSTARYIRPDGSE